MKTSNIAAVVGRKKCRKVLTKVAVHIQKTVMHIGTAQQTEDQNLESMDTSYIILSGSKGMTTMWDTVGLFTVTIKVNTYNNFYYGLSHTVWCL